MDEIIKRTAKSILPAVIVHRIQQYRNHDAAKARRSKSKFLWTAFKALDVNGIDGDYAEFGCHSGTTFRLAFDQIRQRKIPRHMWAFDSFQGFPEASSPEDHHPVWRKGRLATSVEEFHEICRSHGIDGADYTVVEGLYEDTLTPRSPNALPDNISLAYIECVLYSSTKSVLEFLLPRLKHGMILALDDYFFWSAERPSGERQALLEALSRNEDWRLLRYRDIGWAGLSFVVERAAPAADQSVRGIGDESF